MQYQVVKQPRLYVNFNDGTDEKLNNKTSFTSMKSMFYAWWQSSALNYVASEHNYVDINKSNDNIIMLHVDIIYFACRGKNLII